MLSAVVLCVSVALAAQSLFSLHLMLYSWQHPERLAGSKGPQTRTPPRLKFSVLLPARNEDAVIFSTIAHLCASEYPSELIQIVVICHDGDRSTIAEVQRAIAAYGGHEIDLALFSNGPINKPHALNVGLRLCTGSIVTVFDAEDDVDKALFATVNSLLLQQEAKVGIVQAGVQLMNLYDHWFSLHNCLEYFFWYKSRLHFHAHAGMIPLGGNTIFIRRELLLRVGGWDESCLTEDADIGIRLSALGQHTAVMYDAQQVTREEVPESTGSFIRQRTRWQQGYIQVLRKGTWLELPRISQRLLALYTLVYPFIQAALLLLWPVSITAVLWLKLSALVAMISFLPLYVWFLQVLVSVVGAYLFTREYELPYRISTPLFIALTVIPYQLLLGISSLRAVAREMLRHHDWEKTTHVGAHRA